VKQPRRHARSEDSYQHYVAKERPHKQLTHLNIQASEVSLYVLCSARIFFARDSYTRCNEAGTSSHDDERPSNVMT
jgi:hypothetical protein